VLLRENTAEKNSIHCARGFNTGGLSGCLLQDFDFRRSQAPLDADWADSGRIGADHSSYNERSRGIPEKNCQLWVCKKNKKVL
jgi:hypothetical protein